MISFRTPPPVVRPRILLLDHPQLDRQEVILASHGWYEWPAALCDHLRECGEWLLTLPDLPDQRLVRSFAISAINKPVRD